jgi:hypothetical protein
MGKSKYIFIDGIFITIIIELLIYGLWKLFEEYIEKKIKDMEKEIMHE